MGQTRREALAGAAALAGVGLAVAQSPTTALAAPVAPILHGGFTFPAWRQAMRDTLDPGRESDLGLWRAYLNAQPAALDAPAVDWLAAPGVRRLNAGAAAAMTRRANEALADHLAATKSLGLAHLSLRDPNAAAEAERAVTELGLSGLVLDEHETGEGLAAPSLFALYEAAEALGAPVMVQRTHAPGAAPAGAPLSGDAADAARALSQLVFAGVFDRFPRLRVAADLGPAPALWTHRMDQAWASRRAAGETVPARRPSDYLDINIYPAAGTAPAGLFRRS